MAADPFEALRLTLMQDVLPVGLAVAERARKGGPRQVLAAFDGSSSDPLGRLREEGEPAAGNLRENLDRIRPGLGNPIMKVDVRDLDSEAARDGKPSQDASEPVTAAPDDGDDLHLRLRRIRERLSSLERRLSAAGDSPSRS
jgi:hypothetical protein